jgi:hypothetical protein
MGVTVDVEHAGRFSMVRGWRSSWAQNPGAQAGQM